MAWQFLNFSATYVYSIAIAVRTTNCCIALGSADSEASGDTLRQEREPTNQLQLLFGLQVVPDQHLAVRTNTEEQEMGMGLLLVRDPCHLHNGN